MFKKRRKSAQRLSAQSSSTLLGLAIALLLTQSAFLCYSGVLSGFGWAILVSLAGCFYTTLSQWTELIQTRVPERSTWIKGIAAGVFLSAALFGMGQALSLSDGNPLIALAVAFVPWSRKLWRRLFVGDTLNSSSEKMISLVSLCAAMVFISPEIIDTLANLRAGDPRSPIFALDLSNFPAVPRTTALLAAVLLGAASSLQRPQDRSIPSRTFWSIPVGVSAILLSSCGWIALHVVGARAPVMGDFENLAIHRLLAICPALLFGVVMLGLRPQIQIKNAQQIGRETVYWWQTLGFFGGIILSVFLLNHPIVNQTDAVTMTVLLFGQILGLIYRRPAIRFAPALSSVPVLKDEEPILNSQHT